MAKRTVKAFVLGYVNGNGKVSPYCPVRIGGAWSAFMRLSDARHYRDAVCPDAVIVNGTLSFDAKPAKRKKAGR